MAITAKILLRWLDQQIALPLPGHRHTSKAQILQYNRKKRLLSRARLKDKVQRVKMKVPLQINFWFYLLKESHSKESTCQYLFRISSDGTSHIQGWGLRSRIRRWRGRRVRTGAHPLLRLGIVHICCRINFRNTLPHQKDRSSKAELGQHMLCQQPQAKQAQI